MVGHPIISVIQEFAVFFLAPSTQGLSWHCLEAIGYSLDHVKTNGAKDWGFPILMFLRLYLMTFLPSLSSI